MNIRVMLVGLGPIGTAIGRQLVSRRGFTLAAAVDIDDAHQGRDAGAVLGLGRRLRLNVTADIDRAIRHAKPDVAVLCTRSGLRDVLPDVLAILQRRVPIVTTTEEAAYPIARTRRYAREIDQAATLAKVAVVGTGVNPGFVMDALPIALTAACARVDRIEIVRVQDARVRRLPFQRKIGAGLTRAEFLRRVDDGRVRHVGFAQSIQMIADAVSWKLDRMIEDVAPKLAERRVESDVVSVEAGRVCGLVQTGTGYVQGEPRITLRLEAWLGAPESYDSVVIEGDPKIVSRIEGGVHGDIATASMAVNAIPAIITAPPGLRTMRDLRLPSFFGGLR